MILQQSDNEKRFWVQNDNENVFTELWTPLITKDTAKIMSLQQNDIDNERNFTKEW